VAAAPHLTDCSSTRIGSNVDQVELISCSYRTPPWYR